MQTLSIPAQNLLLAATLIAGAPWLMTEWQDLGSKEVPTIVAVSVIAGLQLLEIIGITLKILPVRKALQTQWNRSCLSLGFLYGIGIPYILLSNAPSAWILISQNDAPLWIGGVIGFMVLKYLYYIGLAHGTTDHQSTTPLRQTLGDWSLTLFVILNASFYLRFIQSGISEPLHPTLSEFLWATLPALFLFGPLEFPRILLAWPTLKNTRSKLLALLSILTPIGVTTWQMFKF